MTAVSECLPSSVGGELAIKEHSKRISLKFIFSQLLLHHDSIKTISQRLFV